MEDKINQLYIKLELLDWDNSFGIYTKKEYKSLRKEIIKQLEILDP